MPEVDASVRKGGELAQPTAIAALAAANVNAMSVVLNVFLIEFSFCYLGEAD
jgi:hypothetical protein